MTILLCPALQGIMDSLSLTATDFCLCGPLNKHLASRQFAAHPDNKQAVTPNCRHFTLVPSIPIYKQDLDAAPWQCTCSHVASYPWIFGEARPDFCAQAPPPHSPDLAPADFFLFPKLKSTLKGYRFQTIEEIKENSLQDLRGVPQNTFQNWKKRWERCFNSRGEYFEGDKSD